MPHGLDIFQRQRGRVNRIYQQINNVTRAKRGCNIHPKNVLKLPPGCNLLHYTNELGVAGLNQ
jgi:hypothetical protein